MVKHDGHLYSSKPPLLPTLMAGEYWVIYRLTGMSLGTHPYEIGRFMLVTLNVIPLAIYFLLLAALVERLGTTDWGRMFVMAAAVFGTFLTTFAVVLNNHLPAAVCAMVALYAAVRIWFDGERRLAVLRPGRAVRGAAGGRRVAGAVAGGRLGPGLAVEGPAADAAGLRCRRSLLVAAGFFGTNWIAHHSLRPPYMHRSARPTTGTTTPTSATAGRCESYWKHPAGHRRGRAVAGRLRPARPGRPSRHLLAHADLAAERRGHAGLAVSAARPAAARAGAVDRRGVGGLPGVLHLLRGSRTTATTAA